QVGGGAVAYLINPYTENPYEDVVDGFFASDLMWVEINGKTMTIHGAVGPVVAGNSVKFNVNEFNVRTIENFKLVTSTTNKYWYTILDEKGEDTLWKVLKDGKSLTFGYGEPSTQELWLNISYEKK
ncbi:MAG: hypothetical protein K2K12_01370, partial [Clostridia bacterium]|nr:hypothetical protein [Clostridia bacterium]